MCHRTVHHGSAGRRRLDAARAYAADVKDGTFSRFEHAF
jgi:ketopantoate hydroxymethyltransferase